jgi:hypothetical protein
MLADISAVTNDSRDHVLELEHRLALLNKARAKRSQ